MITFLLMIVADLTILGEVWRRCALLQFRTRGARLKVLSVTAASSVHPSLPLPASHTKAEPCWIEKADLFKLISFS